MTDSDREVDGEEDDDEDVLGLGDVIKCLDVKDLQDSFEDKQTNGLKLPMPENTQIPGVIIKISNMVYTCNLGFPLDPNTILKSIPAQCNIKTFPGVVIRIKGFDKKSAVLLFESGMLVVTGVKLEDEAKHIIVVVVNLLKNKVKIPISNYIHQTLTNIVATMYIETTYIDIKRMSVEQSKYCSLTKRFPGLIVRHKGLYHPLTALVFNHGRIVLVGGANVEHTMISGYQIYEYIKPYSRRLSDDKNASQESTENHQKKDNTKINSMVSIQRETDDKPKVRKATITAESLDTNEQAKTSKPDAREPKKSVASKESKKREKGKKKRLLDIDDEDYYFNEAEATTTPEQKTSAKLKTDENIDPVPSFYLDLSRSIGEQIQELAKKKHRINDVDL